MKKIFFVFLLCLMQFSFAKQNEKRISNNTTYSYGYSIGLTDGVTFNNYFNFFINNQHIYPIFKVGAVSGFFAPSLQVGLGYQYQNFHIDTVYATSLPFNGQHGLIKTVDEFSKSVQNYMHNALFYEVAGFEIDANLWFGHLYQGIYRKNKYEKNGDPWVDVIAQTLVRTNLRLSYIYYTDLYNDLYIKAGFGLTHNTHLNISTYSFVGMLPMHLGMTGWGELLIMPRLKYTYNPRPDIIYDKNNLFSIDNSSNPNPMTMTVDFSNYNGDMKFSVPITYRFYPLFWAPWWSISPLKGIYIAPTFYQSVIWKNITKKDKTYYYGYSFIGSIGYRAYKMGLNLSFGVGYSPQKGGSGIVLNFLQEL